MQSNFTIGVPTPETAPEPTRYLTMPDGETRLPLEYPCRRCGGVGNVDNPNYDASVKNPQGPFDAPPGRKFCPACKGKCTELSMQGRALLAFLKKWWDHAEEAPERPWSAQDNVLAAAKGDKKNG